MKTKHPKAKPNALHAATFRLQFADFQRSNLPAERGLATCGLRFGIFTHDETSQIDG